MITRFRVEGKGRTRDEVADKLLDAVGALLTQTKTQRGEWECTQEVIVGNNGNYKGRMVMLFHPEVTHAH